MSLQIIMALAVTAVCTITKYFLGKHIFWEMLIEAVSLAVYVGICYFEKLLEKYMYLFMLYVILDLLHLVIAVAGFPLMVLLRLRPKTMGAEIVILILQIVLYTGFILWSRRLNLNFL